MKHLILFALLALVIGSLAAQTAPATLPSEIFGAAGASYCPSCSPNASGTALVAYPITQDGSNAAFFLADAFPTLKAPYTVTTQVTGGYGRRVVTLKIGGKPIELWIPVSVGPAWNGVSNVGWSYGSGALATFNVGPVTLAPNVRVMKSSVNSNSGFQLAYGLLIGGKISLK